MVLYVRNLTLSTTEDELRDVFSLKGTLKVAKVKKIRDFAFIHYRSREEACRALEAMQNAEINGSPIEVTWSKPVDRSRNQRPPHRCRFSDVRKSYCGPPVMMASPSAAFGYDFYPLGSPRIPPIGTGRPVESPRMPNHSRGRGAGGVRGYRPVPMRITPLYARTMQILLDVCHKSGWGEPQFQLHTISVPSNGPASPESTDAHNQLYLYKVTLPDLPTANNTFTPNKLCRNIEEAKGYAAEHVLGQLGIRPEMPQPDMAHLTSPLYVAAPMGNAGYGPYSTFLPPGSPSVRRHWVPGSVSPSPSPPHSLSPPPFQMYGGARPPHYGYEAAY
ncbi:unnamed protein product [Ixodes hexagonus]